MNNKLKTRWQNTYNFHLAKCTCEDFSFKQMILHTNNTVWPVIFPNSLIINSPVNPPFMKNSFYMTRVVEITQRDITLTNFYMLRGVWDFEETNRILLVGQLDFSICGVGMVLFKDDTIHGLWTYEEQLQRFYHTTML